ncbi:MAG: helix-turn-helix domain-containing protein [Candidatus Caldarchaeum sp.]
MAGVRVPAWLRILKALASYERPLTAAAVERITRLPHSTTSVALSRMVKRGLVERRLNRYRVSGMGAMMLRRLGQRRRHGCSFCGGKRVALRWRAGNVCNKCLRGFERFLLEEKGVRLARLVARIIERVEANGRLYVSSAAWYRGLRRSEVKPMVYEIARIRGWDVEETENNHIILYWPGFQKTVQENAVIQA